MNGLIYIYIYIARISKKHFYASIKASEGKRMVRMQHQSIVLMTSTRPCPFKVWKPKVDIYLGTLETIKASLQSPEYRMLVTLRKGFTFSDDVLANTEVRGKWIFSPKSYISGGQEVVEEKRHFWSKCQHLCNEYGLIAGLCRPDFFICRNDQHTKSISSKM